MKLFGYLDSPRTLERLDLVLITDVFGELDYGGPLLRGFHAQRTTVRWVDVELKNSSIVVRSFNSLNSAAEPFSRAPPTTGRHKALAETQHLRRV